MTKKRTEIVLAVALFTLSSCVCGQFQLEAAEGANITLQWDNVLSIAPSHLVLYCYHLPESEHRRARTVLEVVEGKQLPGPKMGQFSGRVLWNKEVLGLGLIQILLTRVSAQDQGQFWYNMHANYHPPTSRWSYTRSEFFNLTVTRTKQPDTRPGAAKHRGSGLNLLQMGILCFMFTYMVLMALAIVVGSLCVECKH